MNAEWFADDVTESERFELGALLRGDVPTGGEVVSSRILRRVVRQQLTSGRVVFGKQHLFPFLRVRLRYALRHAPAIRERNALEIAARRHLQVPAPLALFSTRGLAGPKLSVLVTEGLPAGRVPDLREAIAAVEQLVEAGVYHPDLHRDNLRMVSDEPQFLDFQSVRFRPTGRSEDRGAKDRIAMIAKFAVGLPRGPEGHVLVDAASIFDSADERREFEDALVALDNAARAARRRHRLRSSTAVVRERTGLLGLRLRLRGVPAADLAASRFGQEALEQHPTLGAVRVAGSSEPNLVRFRAQGRLRECWAKADENSRFLAWERTAPWPWTTQSLYILRETESEARGGDALSDDSAKGRAT